MKDKDSLESHYHSAAEIWQVGCTGAVLEPTHRPKFITMARSRFHTFQLSINHSQTIGDGAKIDALVRGLAIELHGAPGLAEQWFDSEFSADDFGELVNANLAQLGTSDKS
ncbi:hypothetical protein OAD22_08600 [Pseudomonadales bacterium]|nr:hypothetical protein [Pseudomonadales bacterium]MDA9285630.1 hypothetical protein [Pseudomonadales bacterium]MDA9298055.1 hypothetical protein [Pseudomonadales bacterium]MDB4150063.1 hypothetical protein [Pseudomonadales bacterium]MDB9868712.1 hypothetical protein [Pseudomonadales bacterium]